MSTEEAKLVIRLIKCSPDGSVKVWNLRKKYEEKYGRELRKRKGLKKWICEISGVSGVFVDDNPRKESIHFGANMPHRQLRWKNSNETETEGKVIKKRGKGRNTLEIAFSFLASRHMNMANLSGHANSELILCRNRIGGIYSKVTHSVKQL